MMRIHREGTATIAIVFILLLLVNFLVHHYIHSVAIAIFFAILSIAFFIFILSFFRKPKRDLFWKESEVFSPCDGKVVVIEETEETEYFKDRRIQVSIFMSPLNVHINYYPLSGKVNYVQYHPGKHMVAWHPKSSLENERSTIVVSDGKNEILIRQIAGTVARRIVTYSKPGGEVRAGDELGFIKFGSRVDVFFPLNTEITVRMGDVVYGAKTMIGKISC